CRPRSPCPGSGPRCCTAGPPAGCARRQRAGPVWPRPRHTRRLPPLPRPSTYASILGTIQNRGYVWKKGTALVPSFTAFAVVGLLERYFGDLVDYGFTAAMEDDLDAIAAGDEESLPWLTRFYFGAEGAAGGNGDAPAGEVSRLGLKREVSTYLGEIDAREINSIPIGIGTDGEEIVARVGRYGPYLQ